MRDLNRRGHPSDFEDWANGCRGKVSYPSRRIAAGAVRVLKATKPFARDNWRLNAYRCLGCGKFHVGHRPGRSPNI